jgi:hypothetical protein
VTPLQLILQMESPWTGPAVKTLLLRSGLGFHLRRRECLTGAPDCAGCPRQRECWYSYAFDSPAALFAAAPLQRLDEHNAHPFYLASALSDLRTMPAGAALPCLLTVFGRTAPLLNRILNALAEAGQSARWGARFRLATVTSPLHPEVWREGAHTLVRPAEPLWPAWEIPQQRDVRAARLRFLSPLRLRIRGQLQTRPDFTGICRSLLRRIHVLAGLYGGVSAPAGWTSSLLDQAAAAIVVASSGQSFREHRNSGRQHRRIILDGVNGQITVAGDLSALWPFLEVGQWIGIGASTGHGLGAYVLDQGTADDET